MYAETVIIVSVNKYIICNSAVFYKHFNKVRLILSNIEIKFKNYLKLFFLFSCSFTVQSFVIDEVSDI
jgi:hypothetical protein